MKNRINLILNAHLPFIRHPEYPKFLEEDWLFEALNESYIPLLRMMQKLKEDGIKFKLTFSLSPTLLSMLRDKVLNEKFCHYMEEKIELGKMECGRTSGTSFHALATLYLKILEDNFSFYKDTCKSDIVNCFLTLSSKNYIELITTAATHAFLPLYQEFPQVINAQIETAIIQYNEIFSKSCNGFWLPYCGYYPGLEHILFHNGIKWTSVAAHSLILGNKIPIKGNYSPICTPNGLWCFPRDHALTGLVWSATNGYPTSSDYRDFYRDIGYDLSLDYIKPFIHEPDVRVFTGFKYYSVTGNTSKKRIYDFEIAKKLAEIHSNNFIYNLKTRGKTAEKINKSDPIFTLSFDAELFGHFWYEGVGWLEYLIRNIAKDKELELTTPSDCIDYLSRKNEKIQIMNPAYSSWGVGGFSQVWLDNETNSFLMNHITKAIEKMTDLAIRFSNQKSITERFLNQAARETLLLMSGDWQYILRNKTSSEYAKKRVYGHIQNLNLVYESMSSSSVNTAWLVKAERKNNIFPHIDYNIFNRKNYEL